MAFWKSRPSALLLFSSLGIGVLTALITYTGFGHALFGFVMLSPKILLFIGAILSAYFLATEVAKRIFFKRYQM